MRSAKTLLTLSTLFLFVTTIKAQEYTGVYGSYPHCQQCHEGTGGGMFTFTPWSSHLHSQAFDSVAVIQNNPSCLPCHTTGWDTTIANGGYDDYYYSGNTAGMIALRNVQCEATTVRTFTIIETIA
jgi:hypothetical protein